MRVLRPECFGAITSISLLIDGMDAQTNSTQNAYAWKTQKARMCVVTHAPLYEDVRSDRTVEDNGRGGKHVFRNLHS